MRQDEQTDNYKIRELGDREGRGTREGVPGKGTNRQTTIDTRVTRQDEQTDNYKIRELGDRTNRQTTIRYES